MSQADGPGAGPPTDQRQVAATAPLARIPGWLLRMGITAWMLIGFLILAIAIYLGSAQISTLLSPLVVAVVMGMLFHPLVDRLQRVGIKRAMSAAIILLGLALTVAMALSLAVRGVFDQASVIADQVERGWQQLQDLVAGWGVDFSGLEDTIADLGSGASSGIGGILTATVSSVGLFLVGVLIGTFLLYYLLKDWHVITDWVSGHVGLPQDLARGLIQDATTSIRQYFYALTMTSIPIAIVIGLVMWLLGLPLAFTVVLVTFVTSYIPYLGAIVSGAFATLVALGSGGLTDALIVLGAVLLTQNLLQTVMLTRLSSATLHIHPIVNFGSTIIGATLAGILGATLSAPIVASFMAAQRRVAAYRWTAGAGRVAPTQEAAGAPPDAGGAVSG